MSRLLRFALTADAAATAATAILISTLGGVLEGVLGIPATLMLPIGVALLPYAAFVGYLASRDRVSRRAVCTVIALNLLWTVDSIALLFTGWIEPTSLGMAFVLVQALIVGALAELQYFGMRQSPPLSPLPSAP